MSNDKVNQILEKFYQFIPEDLLAISTSTKFSRTQKRMLEKEKNLTKKLNIIISDELMHSIFIENLYEEYLTKYNEISELNSEEIINIIDSNNFQYYTIYLIKKYYFDKKSKKSIIDFLISSEFQDMKHKFKDLPSIEKEKLNKYLCLIKEENNFYNIYPKYIIENSTLQPVDAFNQFPEKGNINIYTSGRYDFEDTYYNFNETLCIIKMDCSNELEENINSHFNTIKVTNKKINGNLLMNEGRIYNINNENLFELIDYFYDDIDLNKIEIKTKPMCNIVYIKTQELVYGPYLYRENGNTHILEPKDDYMLKKFILSDNLNITKLQISYSETINLIYFDNKQIKFEYIDTITKDLLLNKFKVYIKKTYDKNEKFSLSELNAILKNSDNLFFSKDRLERLKKIFSDYIKNGEYAEEIGNILILLIKDPNSTLSEEIVKKILNNNDLVRKLQNVKLVQDLHKKLSDDIEYKQLQLKLLEEKIDTLEQNNEDERDEMLIQQDEEIRSKIEKLEKLNIEIKNLKETHSLSLDIVELKSEIDFNKRTRDNLIGEIKQKQSDIRDIEKKVSDKLSKAMEQYPDIAFDGMIANKMLEKASQWEKNNLKIDFENIIHKINNIVVDKFENNEKIKEYIYSSIKKYRPSYTNNEITNFMICLTQGFLTVFAGEPGVGKTSICYIISKILGLELIGKRILEFNNLENPKGLNLNRYIEVSVERGWTSKRDFIGYYNPLTKTFDKNNNTLFSSFNILHLEKENNLAKFPFYILLDEANLSSMEHYWADFMNVCDFDKENRSINIGEDFIFNLPHTLRFLATINYDHTTEALSPRLIDRSWVIMLYPKDNDNLNISDIKMEDEKIISFESLESIFSYKSYEDELNIDIERSINEIYFLFEKQKISISPRIKIMIKRYLIVGQHLFTHDENTIENFIALDYVVSQKLLPKIDGYGETFRIFLEDLNKYCDDNNMMITKKIIKKILNNGEKNMHYYQFFS